MKKVLKKIMNKFGYNLINIKKFYNNIKSDNLFGTFLRITNLNVKINTIIDVGASDGRWTREVFDFYPESRYFLIEANREHEENLIKYKKENSNIDYIIAAAAEKDGKIFFDNSDLWGGYVLNETNNNQKSSKVKAVKIDSLVKNNNLAPKFLIKMDTHGYEVPILKGARNALNDTEIIILEVYNFKLTDVCLRFYEMCNYLSDFGFHCIDIFDVVRRPKDNILWQMDMVFIKNNIMELKSNSYR